MYVITFYSFKGGVGRTMALVNVAAELARKGRKVLVVDFDLEAPGLETYKRLAPPEPHPGVVEYVAKFRQTFEVPDLRNYIYETKPIGKKNGRLWVMPAGCRDKAYRNALLKLDWQQLYRDEQGFLLFEDMKAGWKKEFDPDYVLIDSRTGDTEVLGICTRQLPDSVVLMFVPNKQNLIGLEAVYRDIRLEELKGLEKRIRLHIVAANLPNLDDEDRILRRQLKAFSTKLGCKDEPPRRILRYESMSLLDQCIVVLDHPRSRLAHSYRQLLEDLTNANPVDLTGRLIEANPVDPSGRATPESSQFPVAIQPAIQADELSDYFGGTEEGLARLLGVPTSGQTLEQTLEFLFRERRWNDFIEAFWKADESVQLNPRFALDLALAEWGATNALSEDQFRVALRCLKDYSDEVIRPLMNATFSLAVEQNPEEKAWALWGVGKSAEAIALVDQAEKWARNHPSKLFSRWCYQFVSLEKYLEDLASVRRLFSGEPVRPDFLGPPTA